MTRNRVVYLVGQGRVELREDPLPSPNRGEIVIRVEAATTCGTDVKVYRRGGHPRMLEVPSPFGHEVSGRVGSLGEGVVGWSENDPVVVANSAACGQCPFCLEGRENLCDDLQYLNGAYGDFLLIPERFVRRSLYRRPEGLDAATAALAEPLACVVHGVDRLGPLAPGSEVLIFGGGPIGLLFVALLSTEGHRITLCDPNPERLAMGEAFGAVRSVRVERDHGEAGMKPKESSRRFDAAVEATGAPAAWESAISATRPGGTVLLFGGCAPGTIVPLDAHRIHYSELTVKGAYHHRPRTFGRALELLAGNVISAGKLLSEQRPLEEVELALQRMIDRKILKAVIRP